MQRKQSQGLSSPMKGSGSPFDLSSSRISPSRSDESVSDADSVHDSEDQQPAAETRRDAQRARRAPAPRAGKAKPKASKASPKASKRLKPAGRHVQQLAKRLNAAAVSVTDGKQPKAIKITKVKKTKKTKVDSPESSDSDDDVGMMKPKGASFGPVAATQYRPLTKALFLRAGEIPRGAVCISLHKWRADVWRLALVVLDSSTCPSDVYNGSHFSPTGYSLEQFRKECARVDFGSEKLADQACEIYGLTVMAVDDLCQEHDKMVAENLVAKKADRHDIRAVMASQVLRRLGPLNRMWSSLRAVGKKVKK